ncbi:hypothetical protein [Acetobacter orleanensis]|uniref:hypothetical protein n=1 Tax=Acetobacter orleanensis TaxID=104099 RepID=UPI001B80285F|nr:hypothetical protein [Acetobacter orleanensis]
MVPVDCVGAGSRFPERCAGRQGSVRIWWVARLLRWGVSVRPVGLSALGMEVLPALIQLGHFSHAARKISDFNQSGVRQAVKFLHGFC